MIAALGRVRLGLALVIVASAAAGGEAPAPAGHRTPEFLSEETPGEWPTTRILGATVVNDRSETIGDVSDLVVGRDGRIVALVVGVGGFLGIGEKSVAVPFAQAELALTGLANGVDTPGAPHAPDRIILPVSREEFAKAPAYKLRSRAGLSLQGLRRAVP